LSLQEGHAHVPLLATRTPDKQSDAAGAKAPCAHKPQPPPAPQSTAVSLPFWTPSLHVAFKQVLFVELHEPDTQSDATMQALPKPQV
jgi:hypothetical protein